MAGAASFNRPDHARCTRPCGLPRDSRNWLADARPRRFGLLGNLRGLRFPSSNQAFKVRHSPVVNDGDQCGLQQSEQAQRHEYSTNNAPEWRTGFRRL